MLFVSRYFYALAVATAETAVPALEPAHDGNDGLRGRSIGQQLDTRIIILPQDPLNEILHLLSDFGPLLVDLCRCWTVLAGLTALRQFGLTYTNTSNSVFTTITWPSAGGTTMA